jgi:hypothetical protein
MEHAIPLVQFVVPLISIIIVVMILTARRRQLFIRRIPGLSAIDEAIGRATEMGRPMICVGGLDSPGKDGIEIVKLQALAIITYIISSTARFATRTIVPVFTAQMLPVTEAAVQDAYASEGRPELYNQDDIRFLGGQQFAFAASVAGVIWRERAAATFFFGYYYAEALILAETGRQVGAIQVAGTPATTQIPFFIAACDYVIIGDEFYAASAYLSREPTALGSLVGQDIAKGLIVLFVVIGSLLATLSGVLGNNMIAAMTKWFTG